MLKLRTEILALCLLMSCLPVSGTPNNPYGAHTFIQDIMSPQLINRQVDWTRTLTGPGGYAKQLFYPITNATVVNPSWQQYVQACYDRDLIPVIRIATTMENGIWQKPVADSPGNYATFANTVKNIVAAFPKREGWPLYIEVLNEPNNNYEWSGAANPVEYGQCLVQVAAALHSLADPRIKVVNAGLSPGGSYDNLAYIQQMCVNVPGFLTSFDAWATHPYPDRPPEFNFHNGLAPVWSYPIDSYVAELNVLANYGCTGIQVIATEGGYTGGSEDGRADQMMRAFRDCYSQWPEVLAVCPWQLSNPLSDDPGSDWVYRDSTGAYPSHTHKIYDSVYKLAKPGMATGTISGTVRESQFANPLANVTVTLQPGNLAQVTDSAGSYIFPGLAPGTYTVTASKANYSQQTQPGLSVTAQVNTVQNFSLSATAVGEIQGMICDSLSGHPIGGALVNASPGGYTTTTANDGSYAFTGLNPATYTLSSSMPGYYSHIAVPVALDAGESRNVNWWMGPGQTPGSPNLLNGYDFESPVSGSTPDGWSTRDGQAHPEIFAIDSSVRYNGVSSVRLIVNGSQQDEMWQMTNYHSMIPGRRYRIEGWVKTQNPSGSVKLIGNFFNDDTTSVKGSFTCSPVLTTTSGWTRLVGYGTAPSFLPNSGGRLQVVLKSTTNSGTVWADNFWAGEDTTGQSPLACPTNLTAIVSSSSRYASLWWQHGVSPGTTGTTIVFRTDRYPQTVNDGTVVADKAGSPGTAGSAQHTNLVYGTRYYYAAFSHGAAGANPSQPVFCSAVLSDVTPPAPPSSVTDEGLYTTSLNTLSATWRAASDPESGVVEYRYRIGVTQGGAEVSDWTSVSTATSMHRSGLSLIPGQTYFITVQARNGAGLWSSSAFSDGILAVKECSSIGEAKLLADGAAVIISDVAATTSSGFSTSAFYIEQPDRSAGIRVQHSGDLAVAVGDRLTLVAKLSTVQSERTLTLVDLPQRAAGQPIRPLHASNAAVRKASLPDPVGLLFGVWGRVTSVGGDSFVITDGAHSGLHVDASRLPTLPASGSYVFVTGVLSVEPGAEYVNNILCPRDSGDLSSLE